ncbi:MAG TPA: hypothetical protein PKG77_19495 [Phycisphaerae bacterium]|nr:hypothetical protein [Phycisphaerae bacterium]HQL75963.1 hypothetical protein [Phycisphaerae bacterium]
MGCCQKVIHGAVALAKVAVGADAAPDAVVAARRDICRQCDQATRNPNARFAAHAGLTTLSRCRACGCFIAAKTKLAGEHCPLNHW